MLILGLQIHDNDYGLQNKHAGDAHMRRMQHCTCGSHVWDP